MCYINLRFLLPACCQCQSVSARYLVVSVREQRQSPMCLDVLPSQCSWAQQWPEIVMSWMITDGLKGRRRCWMLFILNAGLYPASHIASLCSVTGLNSLLYCSHAYQPTVTMRTGRGCKFGRKVWGVDSPCCLDNPIWLPIRRRITFKTPVLAYKCHQHGTAQ